jgi:hypothetical protein
VSWLLLPPPLQLQGDCVLFGLSLQLRRVEVAFAVTDGAMAGLMLTAKALEKRRREF